ncbi:MAG: DedA family protein [Planctomycetes bacterium]|nr:DedA family protein [Planctomycetota bacterium]
MSDLLHYAIDVALHLDRHLNDWAGAMGPWLYLLLFAVIFCETGLVVTPFLPGDSLLFAVGALAATEGSPLSLPLIGLLLFAAAVAGDAVNYSIGYRVGPRVFTEGSRLFKREHLVRTQRFYEKHGGKTIVIARFVPIIRTFAPFVAGIGRMRYPRFALFNVTGGFGWVAAFLLLGYTFGNLPIVKKYFQLVVVGIVAVSLIPILVEYLKARAEARARRSADPPKPPVPQA